MYDLIILGAGPAGLTCADHIPHQNPGDGENHGANFKDRPAAQFLEVAGLDWLECSKYFSPTCDAPLAIGTLQ